MAGYRSICDRQWVWLDVCLGVVCFSRGEYPNNTTILVKTASTVTYLYAVGDF